MAQAGSLVTDELKKLVGVESSPEVWEIEKGAIIKFAQAVDDYNPLWNDEQEARKTRYGGMIAPPTFTSMLRNEALYDTIFQLDLPTKRVLNAGNEVEFFEPIRPGDTITVTGKLAHIAEREGSMGRMLILTFEYTYKNQTGKVVCIGRNNIIRY
jgi:acyl dehydratase